MTTSIREKLQSIKLQAGICLAVLFLSSAGLVVVVTSLLSRIETGRENIKEEWQEVRHVIALSRDAKNLHNCIYHPSSGPSAPRSWPDIRKAADELAGQLRQLSAFQRRQARAARTSENREAAALSAIEDVYQDLKTKLAGLEKRPEADVQKDPSLYSLVEDFEQKVSIFARSAEKEFEEGTTAIKGAERRTEAILIGWMIVLVGFIATLITGFVGFIVRPINKLYQGVQKIRMRDFGHRIEIQRSTELKALAEAINIMAEELALYSSNNESELERSHRLAAIGRLAAGVAHEINNPLASIGACSEGILRRWEQRSPGEKPVTKDDIEYLRQIRQEVYRCKSITEKLLDFSRNRPIKLEAVDLSSLVNDTIRLLQHQISNQPIEISVNAPSPAIFAQGDSAQLRQVILNLLLNAVDAVEGSGKIEIELGPRDQFVDLTMKDTGTGMSEEDLRQIFDPFFSTKTSSSGTGLGLALCYSIVKAHSGFIRASSPGPGQGSTFTVSLPLYTPATKSTTSQRVAYVG